MDIDKFAHELAETFSSGYHFHLSLFAGLIGTLKRNVKDKISDLGDLGDNVPATLLKSLSSRRGL